MKAKEHIDHTKKHQYRLYDNEHKSTGNITFIAWLYPMVPTVLDSPTF